jgi:outer membrane protein assembly factor BamE
MQKACRTILMTIALVSLGGCSYFQFPGVYKLEVQQGNIIEQKMIDQLKPGMTKRQVKFVLGSPLVTDTFNQDRWDYVYTIATRLGEYKKEQVSIIFKDDKLVEISGDYRPSAPTTGDTDSDASADDA